MHAVSSKSKMSASIRTGTFITRTTYFLESSLIKDIFLYPRVVTQYQPTRGRRRTCHPPAWFMKRKTPKSLHQKQLTKDNSEFLHNVAEERAIEKLNSPLKEAPWARNEYDALHTRRTGVLAVKLGVIPQWTKAGKKFHVSLLQVLDNHVVNYVPPETYKTYESFKDKWRNKGYGMQVVGALSCDPFQFDKAYNSLFSKAGVPPKRKLTRFLITPDAAVQPGTQLTANHFKVGHYVDVQAKTIGHGFQGVVKRWGFKGGPASHGNTKFHRRPGSLSGGSDKAAVWKGKKMPGHMGMDWNTLRGLRIWRINTKYNILYVMGPNLPGPTHCYIRIYDSALKHRREELLENGNLPPMPTFLPEDIPEEMPEEYFDEEIFKFEDPTITYEVEKEDPKKKALGRR